MGLRDKFDGVADKAASVISSVFVTTPDHPNRGGNTGQGPGVEKETGIEDRPEDGAGRDETSPEDGGDRDETA